MPSTRSTPSTSASAASPSAAREDPPSPPPAALRLSAVAPPSSSSSKRPMNTSPTTTPRKRARPSPLKKDEPADPQEQGQAILPSSSRLPLLDGEVYYLPSFVDEEQAKGWYDQLLGVEEWYQPKLKMYGKEIVQSRKIAAYSTDPTLTVRYSGTSVQMHSPYPPLLAEIQRLVERELGMDAEGGRGFNHCMMNLYEDGNVYIGNHRDNKENRVIASLSLGAERTFILTHDSHSKSSRSAGLPSSFPSSSPSSPSDGAETKMSFLLASGSLLVMQGKTQERWKHEIPKEFAAKKTAAAGGKRRVEGGRISLTFRQLSG